MSDLANVHNQISEALTRTVGEDEAQARYDAATDLAIDLISRAGYIYSDDDDLFHPVHDDLQTLLVATLLRSQGLRMYLSTILEDL